MKVHTLLSCMARHTFFAGLSIISVATAVIPSNVNSTPITAEVYARSQISDVQAFDSSGNKVDVEWFHDGNEFDAGSDLAYSSKDAQVQVISQKSSSPEVSIQASSSNPDDYQIETLPEVNFGLELEPGVLADPGAFGGYSNVRPYSVIPDNVTSVEVTIDYSYGIVYVNDNAKDFIFSPALGMSFFDINIDISETDFKPEDSFEISESLSKVYDDLDGLKGFGPFGHQQNSIEDTRLRIAQSPVPAAVPIPATVWLFGSGLIGLVGVRSSRSTPSFLRR